MGLFVSIGIRSAVRGLLHSPYKGTEIAASVLHPRVKGGVVVIWVAGDRYHELPVS